jgi:diguanylate cyclase (GGDEF)-like protein
MNSAHDIVIERPVVLVVDDTPDNLAMISHIVKDSYHVRVANNGEKGLKIAFSDSPPELILLDIMMPGMDGYEMCRQLKLNPATRDIPVIFLTAKTEIADEEMGLALGAVDYITKPISPPILMARIRTHLTLKASTDLLRDENRFLESEVVKRTQEAFYDALTDLPNRRLLMDKLSVALEMSEQDEQYGAVMFLDLDQFKALNDSKGHHVGDMLLIEVALRLTSCIRELDTVAHLGGDKFVVVLEMLGHHAQEAETQAEQMGKKIRHALSQSYPLKNYVHDIRPNMGVVLFKGARSTVDALLQQADIARQHAKTAGRNEMRFYDPVLQADVQRCLALKTELHLALEKEQFRVLYQIQVDSALTPLGAEGLLRWAHPQRGLLQPDAFMSLLAEMGLSVTLGGWVLKTVCQQLVHWENNRFTEHLTLAVNISTQQFHQPDFVEQLHDILQETGANPARLKLELTESTMLENVDSAILKMQALKNLGVSLSMDDFGMGYSSLRYLKRLCLDQIKIDQTFVRGIEFDTDDAAIVRTIIAMGNALDLSVIAEGVETQAQWKFLERQGCDVFQGFLFGQPTPADEFYTWLEQRG